MRVAPDAGHAGRAERKQGKVLQQCVAGGTEVRLGTEVDRVVGR